MVTGVYANDYSIEFMQDGGNLFVSEQNGDKITNFTISDGLDRTSEGYYFIKRLKAVDNFSNFIVTLRLDAGMIANTNNIFPIGYDIKSDGQTIAFVWNYSNVKSGDDFAYFVEIENKNDSLGYGWIYFGFVIVLVVAGFFVFRHLKNRTKDVDKYLLDDERKVIQLLNQAEWKGMWQKNIQNSLGFSKAKLSRMIRNLESRGLIEKIPIGNTNKVRLK
jgi:hypothetical protein